MGMDDKYDKVQSLIDRVKDGERLSEDEVADVLCTSRDVVLLSIAQRVQQGNFEDMSSVELLNLDKTGSGRKKYSRKDIFRIFNVLQNAVERYALKEKSSESPAAALEAVWQSAIDRAVASNQS
jgi:hypothetical protein